MAKGKGRNKGILGRNTERRKEEERRESADIYEGTVG
jgi:hypothetical protein